jgi:hypothetical protein
MLAATKNFNMVAWHASEIYKSRFNPGAEKADNNKYSQMTTCDV